MSYYKLSVFSNKIKGKPSEILRFSKECAGAMFERYLLAGSHDEPMYMIKPDVQPWLKWINEKILYAIPDETYLTISVRVRIATSMLNNLEKEGILTKDICMKYHDRLVRRTKRLVTLVNTEDLPF